MRRKFILFLILVICTQYVSLKGMSALWEYYCSYSYSAGTNLIEVFKRSFLRGAHNTLPDAVSITISPADITEEQLQQLKQEASELAAVEVILTEPVFEEEYDLLRKYFPYASFWLIADNSKFLVETARKEL